MIGRKPGLRKLAPTVPEPVHRVFVRLQAHYMAQSGESLGVQDALVFMVLDLAHIYGIRYTEESYRAFKKIAPEHAREIVEANKVRIGTLIGTQEAHEGTQEVR